MTVPDFPYFVFSARGRVVGCYILQIVIVLYEWTTIVGGGCDSSYMWEVVVTGTTRCSASRSLCCVVLGAGLPVAPQLDHDGVYRDAWEALEVRYGHRAAAFLIKI